MNIVIIGNPVAGRGQARGRIEQLANLLRGRGHEVDTQLTEKSGDARDFAARLHDRHGGATPDRLVVAGGDGTLNEVINGLVETDAIPIVPFAMGTANILARDLCLPRGQAEPMVDVIESGRVRRLDMGVIDTVTESDKDATRTQASGEEVEGLTGGHRFLLVASAGFDAMVIDDIARHRGGKLGFQGYVKPITRTFLQYREPSFRVTVDDGGPIHGALVVVSNIRNYAAFLSITDKAVCDSGVMDVCIFPRGRSWHLMRYALAAWRKRVSMLKDVTYVTGRTIKITSADPVPVQVDGESCGRTPATIVTVPSVVPIVCGE